MGLRERVRHELTGRRVVWNALFYLGHIAVFAFGWHKQASDARLAVLNGLRYSVWISRGAGLCLGVDGSLLLMPVLRNVLVLLRPTLSRLVAVDESHWFHRQIAYSMLFFTIVHTTAHYVNFINVERTQVRQESAVSQHYSEPGGFTGHVMLLIMLAMYSTAHATVRRQQFEVFWYTHHLALPFFVGLWTHATGCFVRGALPGEPVECLGYRTYWGTIWAGVIYIFERLYREIVGVLMHPSSAMEIRFTKSSVSFQPGQYVFLNVPEISRWQWHPFTISSAPADNYISVHVRQTGDWTTALGERLGCTRELAARLTEAVRKGDTKRFTAPSLGQFYAANELAPAVRLPMLRVDGPYGAPAEDIYRAGEIAILIAAGVGVTPFASHLRHLLYMQRKKKLAVLRRVEFIWINRDTSAFEWFASLLSDIERSMAEHDPGFLTISMYLTQRLTDDMVANIALNDAGAESDPITALRARTQFGRPNWKAIFTGLRDRIENGSYLPGREAALQTDVGVFFCGPSPLAKAIKEQIDLAQSPAVEFHFRKERF